MKISKKPRTIKSTTSKPHYEDNFIENAINTAPNTVKKPTYDTLFKKLNKKLSGKNISVTRLRRIASFLVNPKKALRTILPQTDSRDIMTDVNTVLNTIDLRPDVPALYAVNGMMSRKRIIRTPKNLTLLQDEDYPAIFDAHFHIENYRQQGMSVAGFLNMMDNVGIAKAVLFGLPLRQTVVKKQQGGHYYTDSDLPLYYFSGTDYYIAEQYRQLTLEDKARLYPMITGINPADIGAVQDIIRLLQLYPKTFVGLGEITVHKEIVTAKIAGEKPSLYSEGLASVYDFAGKVGLVCLLHNDIDTMMIKSNREMPRYFEMLLQFFQTHKRTKIIWAHCGLGRYVTYNETYIPLLDKLLATCPNVMVDIAWDEVARYIVKNSDSIDEWSRIITKYPTRFMYGSDLIAPHDLHYKKTFAKYKPLLNNLPPAIAHALVYENAHRTFERARSKVNKWSSKNLAASGIVYEIEGHHQLETSMFLN